MDQYTALTAQIEALTARLDKSHNVSQAQSMCDQCGVSHDTGACAQGVMFTGHEEVDYMGNQNRLQNNAYSSTYNPGWKNHLNFGWKSGSSNQNPLGFAQHAPAPQQSQGKPYQSHRQSYQSRPNNYHNQGAGSSSQQHAPQGDTSKLEEMMA